MFGPQPLHRIFPTPPSLIFWEGPRVGPLASVAAKAGREGGRGKEDRCSPQELVRGVRAATFFCCHFWNEWSNFDLL